MKQLLDAPVVEVLRRSARPTCHQRKGPLICDAVVVERKLPGLLVCVEECEHTCIRTHRLKQPVNGDLEKVRRQVLESVPGQNAVVCFRRKVEVLRHELICEQRIALVAKAIGNTPERGLDAANKVLGGELVA